MPRQLRFCGWCSEEFKSVGMMSVRSDRRIESEQERITSIGFALTEVPKYPTRATSLQMTESEILRPGFALDLIKYLTARTD